MEISARLESDRYTSYVTEFYRRGLKIAGENWQFMDIVSVLYAAAAMGQPENYLEIGVRRGRSACAVVAGCMAYRKLSRRIECLEMMQSRAHPD
jgi:predicted O-methyltransferase YrrM